jgi:selenocysteine-specific elongation factor
VIIATAGHVDHGKTSLVRALTGIDTDRLAEEKRRGLTIDLGYAYADWQDDRVGIVDVPGHQRFVGNMLAGVTGMDVALLVVAADDGPMPQTREHLEILTLLGIRRGVIAVTKTDLVTPERLQDALTEIDALVAGSPLDAAVRVPVSAVREEGITELREALRACTGARGDAAPDRGFRFAIDRAFTVPGAGLVVTGFAHAGQVSVGDELMLALAQRRVRVRGLRALDRAASIGRAGDRLALNITGADLEALHRGDWLVAPQCLLVTSRFDAHLIQLPDRALRNGLEVHVHQGAGSGLGRVTLLDESADGTLLAHVSLRSPMALHHGDRVILRDAAARETLAGGRVLDPLPPARGRRRPERLQHLARLRDEAPASMAAALLRLAPLGLDLTGLALRLNLDAEQLAAPVEDALLDRADGLVLRSASAWSALIDQLAGALGRFHAAQPQLGGMREDELRAVLDPRPERRILRAALRDAIRRGRISQAANRFRLPDHHPRLAGSDGARWQKARPVLEAELVKPPTVHDLARQIDEDPRALSEMLVRVHHAGEVVRIAENRFMLPEGVVRLAEAAARAAEKAPDGLFEARAFRDEANIGRNLAIDVLEYFDRAGLTRRRGDARLLVGSPAALFGRETPAVLG